MASIPKVISNKTVLTGLVKSSLEAGSLFPPMSGPAGEVGKIIGASATPMIGKMGTFKADAGAMTSRIPILDLGRPNFVAKKVIR